jgi:hypothetical protein
VRYATSAGLSPGGFLHLTGVKQLTFSHMVIEHGEQQAPVVNDLVSAAWRYITPLSSKP